MEEALVILLVSWEFGSEYYDDGSTAERPGEPIANLG